MCVWSNTRSPMTLATLRTAVGPGGTVPGASRHSQQSFMPPLQRQALAMGSRPCTPPRATPSRTQGCSLLWWDHTCDVMPSHTRERLGLKMKRCGLCGRQEVCSQKPREDSLRPTDRPWRVMEASTSQQKYNQASGLILNPLAAALQKYKETGEMTIFTYFNSM